MFFFFFWAVNWCLDSELVWVRVNEVRPDMGCVDIIVFLIVRPITSILKGHNDKTKSSFTTFCDSVENFEVKAIE